MQFNKSITNDNIHFHHIARWIRCDCSDSTVEFGEILWIRVWHLLSAYFRLVLNHAAWLFTRRHRWRDATDCLITFHSMPCRSRCSFLHIRAEKYLQANVHGCACTRCTSLTEFFFLANCFRASRSSTICLWYSANLKPFFPHDVYVCGVQWC